MCLMSAVSETGYRGGGGQTDIGGVREWRDL